MAKSGNQAQNENENEPLLLCPKSAYVMVSPMEIKLPVEAH